MGDSTLAAGHSWLHVAAGSVCCILVMAVFVVLFAIGATKKNRAEEE